MWLTLPSSLVPVRPPRTRSHILHRWRIGTVASAGLTGRSASASPPDFSTCCEVSKVLFKCIIIINVLLDVAKVLLDLGLELAGGDQHLGRGSPVRDGAEQNLDQVRNLARVVAGDGAVLALVARIVRTIFQTYF